MKHKDLYILKKRVHHHEELKSHPYINYSSIIIEHSSPILQGQGITWVPQGALTHK